MHFVDLKEINKIQGVTCFEYCYCLALRCDNRKCEILYYKSMYSYKSILSGMIANKQNYLTYDDVGRIHHLGNNLNYLKFKHINCDYKELIKLFSDYHKFPIIAKVLPEKVKIYAEKNPYFQMVNNHLILLYDIRDNNIIRYYDPMLRKEIEVLIDEFIECYDKSIYFLYDSIMYKEKDIGYFIEESKNEFKKHIIDVLNDSSNYDINELLKCAADSEEMLLTIRDSIGVTRVLTNRAIEYFNYMKQYFKQFNSDTIIELLNERLRILNKEYIVIEYHRKKKMSIVGEYDMFNKVDQIDNNIKFEISQLGLC